MKPLNVIGLTILSAGALILVGFGLYRLVGVFLKDSSIPAIIKWGIVGLVLGLVILLISLIAERIKDRRGEE
ncbi:hypothetical protein ACFL6S_18650 [Candidatus Poribacteria bacterium]